MLTRTQIEKREYRILAPYAMKSAETRGRVYKEKEHDYRSAYQRDKDRIIYSTAFRRLEYKTQVFVNHEGDYYRTRLTHTLEVAQIAKSIARALCLNEDLTEAIALAHDLGHTPFGHAGEDALRELMKRHGGFEHNAQGLRVVDLLEEQYPEFPGLNLSWEVREGIAKHSTLFDHPSQAAELGGKSLPILETQAVDMADEIAYDNHDLDDGITSGMIDKADLQKIDLWSEAHAAIALKYKGLSEEKSKYQIIRKLIDSQVTDSISESEKNIKRKNIKSSGDVKRLNKKVICFSNEMFKKRKPLRQFLMNNLYQHYRIVRMSDKAIRFIKDLFRVYLTKPQQLPPKFQKRLKKEGAYRVICDYIAGMTDRYALDEYKKFFEPYERV
ncbi:MAG: deoxyguanosinetriphosphate triphosphohydrolase [Candidatus Omnitrophica bacterium]|nr:deoxyguanosinetriphosphate triphosphohydrolase [Candidatus Omnitrophota bacterium]MBU4488901.1 deoxyguanosinetriphosphate triphosphohydrolase [Candidatus Omnitrophota bacterium]